jgi:hypothetical protein
MDSIGVDVGCGLGPITYVGHRFRVAAAGSELQARLVALFDMLSEPSGLPEVDLDIDADDVRPDHTVGGE